ncbi:MAG: hypothetical protein AAGJ28_17365 [Pseudomonadota bacterium]
MTCAAFLTGCGTVDLFGRYDLPEDPATADAPYPRLVDTPAAPAPGTYTAAVPDPADGAALLTDLTATAVAAEIRRDALSAPVLSDAERAEMQRRAQRTRE